MTRIAVMDEELHELLTIIEAPIDLLRAIEARQIDSHYRFPVALPMPPPSFPVGPFVEVGEIQFVTLRFEPVHRGRGGPVMFWYAYALEPELALLLRAAFLPGQVGEVQNRERMAFIKGYLESAVRDWRG